MQCGCDRLNKHHYQVNWWLWVRVGEGLLSNKSFPAYKIFPQYCLGHSWTVIIQSPFPALHPQLERLGENGDSVVVFLNIIHNGQIA